MSRHTLFTQDCPTKFHYGNDHAIGKFLDITDWRYAGSKEDEQGEGYVFEWSELFGISTNLIGATLKDIKNPQKLLELTEKFIKSKGLENRKHSKTENELLKEGGWILECKNPFTIFHKQSNSRANGWAAHCVIHYLRYESEKEKNINE